MNDALNGRFSIVETIFDDRLYKAVDTATGDFTAIKKWKSGDEAYNNELSALMSITHPAVPRIIDCFRDSDGSYIAEEWLEGGPLSTMAAFPVITDFAVSCAEFLCYLTADKSSMRIHGDIKPSNLMLRHGKVCFIDFESSVKATPNTRVGKKSAAAAVNADAKKNTLSFATEFFTAPEVFYGKICPQSDIYSLGMVLAWMLGGLDETGLNLDNISDSCALKPIIRKCIAADLKTRYADAQTLLKALERLSDTPASIRAARDRYTDVNYQNLKLSLYVDCNVCFGWELAATAAMNFGMKTCIIALTERTQKKLSYYAENDRSYGEAYAEEEAQPYIFDYRSIYQRGASEWYSKGFLHKSDENENLYYSGLRLVDELEPDNKECIEEIVHWSRENFNCAVFITDRYDDKPAVKNLSAQCDYTIATPLADIDDIEACKNYYEAFGGSVLYAAWEFNDKYSLPEEGISMVVGSEKYLGAVSHDDERTVKRNYIGKIRPIFHSETDDSVENAQYIEIINKLLHTVYGGEERTSIIV